MNFKINFLKSIAYVIFLLGFMSSTLAQTTIELKGVVLDNFNDPIPYAAVGIPSKYLGTSTNDEGAFVLKLTEANFTDILEISSIGFKTYKVKVEDYVNNKTSNITLEEEVMSLDAVVLENPDEMVKKALKRLKKTALSSKHQIDMLYRRSSVENGKTRFMVEHYLNLVDYGPTDVRFDEIGLAEARKSADYRFAFRKQAAHAVKVMAQINPLRQNIYDSDYTWEKLDYTSYDGEDILIVKGTKKNQKNHKENNWIKFYIGMDTYAIYKVDVSRYASEFSNLKAFYIYKKDSKGQLVLSYHNREANFRTPISELKQKQLNLKSKNVVSSYRHEAIVLNVQGDKKKINPSNVIYDNKDIGDYDVAYNPDFWKSIALPPQTKFYKKSVKELESIYGVSLEKQFEAVNK